VHDPETGGTLQAWYTNDRQDLPTLLDSKIDVFDLEYHRELELGEASKLLVGGGYRLTRSILEGYDPFYLTFDPEESTQNVFRAFVVHTTDLSEDVELTSGLTVEHNDFTQFEVQPTLRAAWTPADDWMAWTSISRAVRTPSLEERFLSDASAVAGSDDYGSEILWAYELGARKRFGALASADAALFFNRYDELHYSPPGFGSAVTNDAEGDAWGFELALDVHPTEWWSLRSAYSILHGDYEVDGTDLITDDYHPEEQLNLRSYIDLGANWELDSAVYAVDRMGPGFEIAEYTRVDVRLGWSPSESLDLFVGVQDFGHDSRSEYNTVDNPRRSVYFGLSWAP
jgi:iron complex outermembrane receptor protein